jgi:hypothetical protein
MGSYGAAGRLRDDFGGVPMTPLYWIAFHIVALWAICLTATRYDCQDRWTATLCGVAAGLNVIALGVRVWAVWHG